MVAEVVEEDKYQGSPVAYYRELQVRAKSSVIEVLGAGGQGGGVGLKEGLELKEGAA